MPESGTPRVAVYIDFDNIVISRYNQLHGKAAFGRDRARSHVTAEGPGETSRRLEQAQVDVGAVLDYASSFGSIVISKAYADWSEPVNASYQQQLVDRAVDLTQMFPTTRAVKNGADIRLAVDVVEDLFRLPDLTHIVIVAGDSDYIALAQRCKRLGRYVIGIGVAGATSRALMAACDEFSDYDDLPGVERPEPIARRTEKPVAEPVAAEAAAAPVAGRRPPAGPVEFEAPGSNDGVAELDERTPDPKGKAAQKAATNLLVRALRLVQDKGGDEEWYFNAEVKNQMMRMDPAFKQKTLGYKTFTDFVDSRSDVVEVNTKAPSSARRLRLRSGS
jgi:uncharacterized LabA/DUF88 family protein